MIVRSFRVTIASLLGFIALNANAQSPQQVEFFEKSVRPLLVEHCLECHGANEKKIKGGLRMNSRAELLAGGDSGPAIDLAKLSESRFLRSLSHTDEDLKMPPKGKLPEAVIVTFSKWVKDGAPFPSKADNNSNTPLKKEELFSEEQKKFWAFQPITRPTPPKVKNASWVKNPIDAFVLAKLEANGMLPALPADKRTLLRRVTYDLTGLPPTPEDLKDFLSDNSPNAWERVIDRLMRSPRYGESQARHWLDVARYADSNGLDENIAMSNAFRYRDYVIKSFNDDKPYDVFVKEQIAGDLFADADSNPDRLTATGFLVIGPKLLAEPDKQKMKLDIADEQLDTIGKSMLGLTLGCARCHDHKFDPIPTKDYYGLLSIFTSTRTMKNLRTVAQAYERALPLNEPKQVTENRNRQIKDKENEKSRLNQEIRDRLLKDAREKVAAYLLASADARGAFGVSRMLNSKEIPKGTIIVEAEKTVGGNADKDSNALGKGIGIIYSIKPENNVAKYSIDIAQDGEYELELRFASMEKRPVNILVNEALSIKEAAKETTGGWNPEHQTWHSEGKIRLKKGKNFVTIQGVGLLPHIDKFAILPPLPTGLEGMGRASAGNVPEVALKRQLVPEFVNGWNEFFRTKPVDPIFEPWLAVRELSDLGFEKNAKPILAKFKFPNEVLEGETPKNLKEFAERYQKFLSKNDAAKKIVNDANGPFKLPSLLPSNPETYFPTEIARISQLNNEVQKLAQSAPPTITVLAVEDGAKYSELRADGKPRNLFVQIRGNYLSPGEEAPAIFPRIVAGEKQTPIGFVSTSTDVPPAIQNETRYGKSRKSSGRMEFANWLADPKNPLTPRVMTNRIWLHLFGEGIVRTPDNFGKLGERPTHPELLDWLSSEFISQGWSIKRLQKLILLSNAYQMSSTISNANVATDPENRLLWRFNRRRLEAEKIRDAVMVVAGTLDEKMGGSLLTNGNFSYVTNDANLNVGRYENHRRSVYLPVLRNMVFDFFQAFDVAEPHVANGKRASTVVAPQALYLMNNPFIRKESEQFAASLIKIAPQNQRQRIELAYLRAFSRSPQTSETAESEKFLKEIDQKIKPNQPDVKKRELQAWTIFCQAVIASSEFIYLN